MPYLRKPADEEVGMREIEENLKKMTRKLRDTPSCDFCGDREPLWIYAASRMSTGEYQQCWRWMACELCASDIENERWKKLLERVELRLQKMLPEGMPQSLISMAVAVSFKEFVLYAVRR